MRLVAMVACGCLVVGAAQAVGDDVCGYGPCACQPRQTLLQWSYGTSFSGGPPGPDEPLSSDRPDFTETSTTVGLGVWQLEAGYTFTHDDNGITAVSHHSHPETLLRVGVLAEWLELRVGWNYANQVNLATPPGGRTHGAEDLYLGLKFGLTPQEGALPEMALVTQMTVPTGADDLTADETLPGLNWLYGWDVTDEISTAGSTQFNQAIDEAHHEYLEFAQSWTVGYSLTERLGAYTEWFAIVPAGAEAARTAHYFDGGFTFRLTNNVQFDVRGGVGLNGAADDYFVGTGFVVRFP